jgi:hypothetical protein
MQKTKNTLGFTLVELVLVIGLLTVILTLTLVAINPREQLGQASDIKAKTIADDFIKSATMYLSASKKYPWEKNADCLGEMVTGQTLTDMPSCVHQLVGDPTLEAQYYSMPELKEIFINRCGDSAVLCYSPKSKIEYEDAETKYTKFGISDPGCAGHNRSSPDCYWCRPLGKSKDCLVNPTPTPVSMATPTPIPTVTPVPTSTPTPVPSPTPIPYLNLVPGYKIDDSKFFQTYAVYFFDYPGFPPPGGGWNTQVSLEPDFPQDYNKTLYSFGIPTTYGPEGPANVSYLAYRKITNKYIGITSITSYPLYTNNCGKTIYWRITNFYNPSTPNKLWGPTYTSTIDCTTKVGVVDPPLSWYTVFNQLTNTQKQYDAAWDFDHNGRIDWTDYWLGTFSTKFRAGGWQPPE